MKTLSAAVCLIACATPVALYGQTQRSVGTIESYGQMPLSAVNWNAISHLVHVDAVVNANGTLDTTNLSGYVIASPSSFVTTVHANGKQALFMINGDDPNFTSATNSANLSTLVSQIMAVVNTYGYDGVELDWEPPGSFTSTQQTQYHNLLVALRQSGNLGTNKLLAADTKSSTGFFAANAQYFDWLDIMTYDNVGVYNNITWHNAPLTGNAPYGNATVAAIMGAFTGAGIPASKLNVGLPFYGYVWTGGCQSGCSAGLTGPLQTWVSGSPSLTFQQYFQLAKTYGNPPGSSQGSYQWDGSAQVSYLSVVNSSNHANDQFVTYDDPQSITAKVNWAKANGFGWFIWTINYAYSPTSGVTDNALLNAVANAWGGSTTTAPRITSTTPLPAGVAGASYSTTLSASGSTPIAWSLTGGALPSGFSLNSAGVISGTPAGAGTSTFSVNASNSAGTASQTFSLTINPGTTAPTISTTSIPGGTVGANYSTTLLATGTTPITWGVMSGSLPSGLTLNSTSGIISGTPTGGGPSAFTISAANAVGTATQALSLSVAYDPYAYWKLDGVTTGTAADSSGNGHTAQLANGPTALGAGSCTSAGCVSFNGASQYGTASLDLSDTAVVTIAFWMNWNGYANDDRLAFELSSNFNNVTTGFMIDPNSAAAGGGQFEVGVLGNAGYNQVGFARPSAGWHHYAFVLNKAAAAAGEVTPYVDGVAVPYTRLATADNTNNFGADTLFFMSRGGANLFGAGGLDEVRIYKRALNITEIQQLAVAVVPAPAPAPAVPPVITSVALPSGMVGSSYSASLPVTGTTPITWTLASGALPAGLTLSASTGAISGTPTVAGPSNFTLQASNSAGTSSAAASIQVAPQPIVPNSTPPAVTITQPAAGSVSGTTTITVAVSSSVTSVQYRLDGVSFATITQAPFTYQWDTLSVRNAGWHTLDAVARDASGNTVTSAPVGLRIRQ